MTLTRDAETEARRRRRKRDRDVRLPALEPEDEEREERPHHKRRRVSRTRRRPNFRGRRPSSPETDSSAPPESPSSSAPPESSSCSPSLPEKESSSPAPPDSPTLPEKEASASALPNRPSSPEKKEPSAVPNPPSLPEEKEPSDLPEEEPGSSSDGEICAEMAERFKQIMDDYAANKSLYDQQIRREPEECNITLESDFCDIDDGSSHGWKARKVALRVSESVVSLSSFSGEKRIRVCSGFMVGSNRHTNTSNILTSATLVRSLCWKNIFHYNLAIVEVKSDEELPEPILLRNVIKRGAVLAIGRFYDHGGVMSAQGKIRKEPNTFDCSELLAGVGGPLVNYSGHVVGINFYGEKYTHFLSSAIIIRCLDQWASVGQINRLWLGCMCTSVDMLPLRDLEKCAYFGEGLYISDVVKGSPFDVAGLSAGDVLIECAGEVLSTAAQLGVVLLDLGGSKASSESNMTVEVVVRKQEDGRKSRKILKTNFLSYCNFNR